MTLLRIRFCQMKPKQRQIASKRIPLRQKAALSGGLLAGGGMTGTKSILSGNDAKARLDRAGTVMYRKMIAQEMRGLRGDVKTA